MHRQALALLMPFALVLAGCASPVAEEGEEPVEPAAEPTPPGPVAQPPAPPPPTATAPGNPTAEPPAASPASPVPPFTRAVALTCPYVCYEPTLAAGPDGSLYVASANGQMAASRDGGLTFEAFAAPELPAGAPPGSMRGDDIVDVSPEGRLYYSALLLTFAPIAPGAYAVALTGIQVAASDDGGRTWASNVFVSVLGDPATRVWGSDRQWLAFGPRGDVYLAFQGHTVLAGTPAGGVAKQTALFVGRSDDGGRTWGPFEVAFHAADSSVIIGTPAVLPSGRLVVPAFEYFSQVKRVSSGLRVAVSDDRGATFRHVTVYAPGGMPGDYFPRLLVTPEGGLLLAWKNGPGEILLAASADGGDTWSEPVRWTEESEKATASPWMTFHGGAVHVAWFTPAEDGTRLTLASAPLSGAGDSARRVVAEGIQGSAMRPASTEFPHMVHLADGRLALVWTNLADASAHVAMETR